MENTVLGGKRIERLNWGCGDCLVPGWVNSDVKEGAGVIACDIREGLPFRLAEDRFAGTISTREDALRRARELRAGS